MKSSIRKFLLINLLLAISITTTLTAIGNYYLDQKDIQEHLDTLMAITTMSSQALLGNDIHKRPLHKIQEAGVSTLYVPQNRDYYRVPGSLKRPLRPSTSSTYTRKENLLKA